MTDTTNLNGAKRVMAIFAHPDDPEFFCGGTLARWAAEGAEVTFVLATSGDKGSADPEMTHERLAGIREEEERNAARALGALDVIFLRYPDGELQPTLELRRDLTRLIRLKQPDIVVTCDPTVYWYGTDYLNHPDHRAIGAAALESVFPTSRDRLNFIELERDEGLATHKVHQVYISGAREPTVKVETGTSRSASIDFAAPATPDERSALSAPSENRRMPESLRELLCSPALAERIAVSRSVRPALAGEQLRYADIEMDLVGHKVKRGGEAVQLGPTEFRLLRHFLEHPGRVFSRERLLDSVWGHDSDIELRTVDVHIRRLRKAVNAGERADIIRTVRPAGYALDSEGVA